MPSPELPWNLERVVHLHRRTGFSASWPELQRDLQAGPKAAIDRILNDVRSTNTPERTTVTETLLNAATRSDSPARLKAWWLYQMLTSPDPLTERLTLMWHNHFATSNRKVNDLTLMSEQNELFRQRGRGRFGDLLCAVVKHPALLVWLDADSNNKGRPNENLARELMELFTLGVGNYTEDDVKDVARALTGWGVTRDHFVNRSSRHDEGVKRVLNVSGSFGGDDVLQILLQQPATAQRLAWRIGQIFLGEPAPAAAIQQLADGLRFRQLDIDWAVDKVVRSETFFSASQLHSRVLGPVEFVVGAMRSLELDKSGVNTLMLADWTTRIGQDLFYPPNVGGWKEGRSWLASSMIVARSNFAAALIAGALWNPAREIRLTELCRQHGQSADLENGTAWLAQLFWGHAEPSIIVEVARTAHEAKSTTPLSLATALLLSHAVHYQA
ncbi:DUF1800 domain-containing protein [Schlesneria paludicola]|uniref:DUF1800 domain-containing protein n=1 Tax=Schlesneria paludicola TaxID=360056 RepID=UPI00029B3BE3|nr:DUF1800 domain-containing protein [Schlesneria paludicola]